jgi:hypothetical protein
MPARARVGVCGFDPMLVKGYVKTGFRALWWHIPDEIFEQFQVKPNDTISGTLVKVWKGSATDDPAPLTHEPNEPFHWKFSKESGLAVLLPPEVIVKYELTEFHFIEVIIDKINAESVNPGEEKESTKMWPMKKMTNMPFLLDFIPPG